MSDRRQWTDRGRPYGARVIRPLPAALALAAVLALTGCGGGDQPAAAPSPSTSSAAPATSAATPRNEVECVNIDRAYNAWSAFRPVTADQVAAMNLGDVQREMEKGKAFLGDVTGYPNQAAKVLATTIAEYNFEVSLANMQVTMGGEMKPEQAKKVADAGLAVYASYQQWRAGTCS